MPSCATQPAAIAGFSWQRALARESAVSIVLLPTPSSPHPPDSELGLGTATVTNYAAQVPRESVGGKAAIAICAGKRHSCAAFKDGTVRFDLPAPPELQKCLGGM